MARPYSSERPIEYPAKPRALHVLEVMTAILDSGMVSGAFVEITPPVHDLRWKPANEPRA